MLWLRAKGAAGWKSALTGFLACALFALVLYLSLYLGAEILADAHSAGIAETSSEPEPAFRLWLVEYAQQVARDLVTTLLSMFAVYWLVAARFKRGSVASSVIEKGLLGFAVAAFLVSGLNQYFGWAETFCDQVPYPHEGFQLTRIYECPSSGIFFANIQLASICFMVASLSVRIIASRMGSQAK